MMFSNGFVLAVRGSTHKVLREIGGQVFLPFHTEYSLLLKNNNFRRAVCSVEIDGTDVLGGHEIILNAYSSLDLERFMVDGNLNSGQRFKFVPLSDSRVQDPSSPDNGIIEVKFWMEKENMYYVDLNPPPPPCWPKYHFYHCGSSLRSVDDSFGSDIGNTSKGGLQTNSVNMMSMQCSAGNQPGATVEGSDSQQAFTYANFQGKDGAPTILRLKLVSCAREISVHKTKKIYCNNCGTKSSFNAKFCSNCGKKLSKKKAVIETA